MARKTAIVAPTIVAEDAPTYTVDGQLKFPTAYREWVFLTSGLDMSYAPKAAAATHSVFDNVFVNPSAYQVFVKTGTWPEGTMFMLENRAAEGNHSINTRGQTQAIEVTGTELHVKDSSHKVSDDAKDGWAFYNFQDKTSAKAIPRAATCYTCHQDHARRHYFRAVLPHPDWHRKGQARPEPGVRQGAASTNGGPGPDPHEVAPSWSRKAPSVFQRRALLFGD